MLFFDEFPTESHLRSAPELATLAILDTALHMTLQAIFAVHPDVNWENDDPDDPDVEDPRSTPSQMAHEIVERSCALLEDLYAYRSLCAFDARQLSLDLGGKAGLPF
ncbi:MAG: hypothetical protein FJZ01_27150 [Candidatus Sericytochromatia bacterium]|nr:hypothetical protein [Candidatus Tanganyikabacteria bacterium]